MTETAMQTRDSAAKEYLLRGWKVELRVRAREAQLDVLRDRMARVRSSAPSGLAGGRKGPRRDWTDAVDALADAESDYLREIAELCRVKRELSEAVATVEGEVYRDLLQYRYLYCLDWDAVADRLGYERRYVFKLHDKALRALEAVLEGRLDDREALHGQDAEV